MGVTRLTCEANGCTMVLYRQDHIVEWHRQLGVPIRCSSCDPHEDEYVRLF